MLHMNSTCFPEHARAQPSSQALQHGRLFQENALEVDGQKKVRSSTAKRSTAQLDFLVGSALTTELTPPEVQHPTG